MIVVTHSDRLEAVGHYHERRCERGHESICEGDECKLFEISDRMGFLERTVGKKIWKGLEIDGKHSLCV